jgi:hypothetical protein
MVAGDPVANRSAQLPGFRRPDALDDRSTRRDLRSIRGTPVAIYFSAAEMVQTTLHTRVISL